jgi:hypothetical protein
MYEAVFVTPWPWWVAGPAIGLIVTLLAWLLGKPLGVSTGKLLAILTVAGIALGTYAVGRLRSSSGAAQLAHSPHPASP